METPEPLAAGDRVTYKRKVGRVLWILGMGFVKVQWDGQSRTSIVPGKNLARVDGRPILDPAERDPVSRSHE